MLCFLAFGAFFIFPFLTIGMVGFTIRFVVVAAHKFRNYVFLVRQRSAFSQNPLVSESRTMVLYSI